MPIDITIHHDHEANKQVILEGLKSEISQALKEAGLDYYTTMTMEQKKEILEKYKKIFGYYKELLNNTDELEPYFQAYEQILQFRKFILGNLGEIDYAFVIRTNEKDDVGIQTIILGSATFLELIKDENGAITGLVKDGDNIRISKVIPKLRAMISNMKKKGFQIKILKNGEFFTLINEKLGTKQNFSDGKLFKSYIQALQRHNEAGKWYEFELDIKEDNSTESETQVFSIEITNAHGDPKSSSIFSAIGKYFTDERIAKEKAAKERNISIDPNFPNAGNLTELYILAKARLNEGKNDFKNPPRQSVAGQDLFALYKQVKRNNDPFYSGGDFLMSQIKSFLGSNPSLTSYKTIRKSIEKFYDALDSMNEKTIKEALSKLLLQKPSTQKSITQAQRKLSENIAKAFEQFFKP